ncbi:hypothetical protein [Halomonas sp. MCCC 1A11062]|jgi:hypothetical protein|nr:hypothetical protein [Halomonas sp. MCCC 1A11062]MCE8036676.1 hypothetical protein [Halomonas sp. MCCC 1A11062]
MSTNRIAFRYVRRFVVTVFAVMVKGRVHRSVYRHDAPVCSMQPGRRRF